MNDTDKKQSVSGPAFNYEVDVHGANALQATNQALIRQSEFYGRFIAQESTKLAMAEKKAQEESKALREKITTLEAENEKLRSVLASTAKQNGVEVPTALPPIPDDSPLKPHQVTGKAKS